MSQRLALFLREQPGDLRRTALQPVGQLEHQLPALVEGNVFPGRERGFGGGHGLVQLIQIRPGAHGHRLFGRRIDDVQGRGTGNQLAIDQQTEIVCWLRAQFCVHE